jgi:mannose-1-phosphate guanylyltransferase
MKAFLLAAGLGTRLRPITNRIPKCMVPIGAKPLLQIWLELLEDYGVEEVLINTHYLPDCVRLFASGWLGTPKVRLSHEEKLLGSAGTIESNWDFVKDEESFLVCNSDNLTDIDLGKLVQFHQGHSGLVTLSLFRSETPRNCGIVEIDQKGHVFDFEEKPNAPRSSLANGGIYVMRSGVRSRLPPKKPSDIGYDLLPQCLGEMYGWLWEGLLIDIGTQEAYACANLAWGTRVNSVLST